MLSCLAFLCMIKKVAGLRGVFEHSLVAAKVIFAEDLKLSKRLPV